MNHILNDQTLNTLNSFYIPSKVKGMKDIDLIKLSQILFLSKSLAIADTFLPIVLDREWNV